MNQEHKAQFRAKAALIYQQARRGPHVYLSRLELYLGCSWSPPCSWRYTALTAKDASLHLKLQHGFHNAQVLVWVDGDLAYSGKITGSTKKRFGLIPTDSVQGSLSEIIPVRSGQHKLRVRIEPDDATMQEDGINGDFAHNSERELSVSARQSGLSLSWLGTSNAPTETSSSFGWFSRYVGSLLLTIGGSIMSALTGYAIRELPARLRSTSESAPKAELGPQ
jgi:hypothetical protein